MNIIKIYGLRRTGTNYLQKLLVHNFEELLVLVDAFHWKHGLPRVITIDDVLYRTKDLTPKDWRSNTSKGPTKNMFLNNKMHYLLCVKDPYSWYLSICLWREIDPFPINKDKCEQLFQWNYMGQKYLDMVRERPYGCSVSIINYESLLLNLDKVLGVIATQFELERNPVMWDSEANAYDGGSFMDKRKFYASRKYIDMYASQDLELMNEFLDIRIMMALGYEIRKNNEPTTSQRDC